MGKAAGIWKKIKNFGKEVWNGITNITDKVVKPLAPLIKPILQVVDKTQISPMLLDTFTNTVDSINEGGGIENTVNNVVNGIGSIFKNGKKAINTNSGGGTNNAALERLKQSGAVW